MISNFQYLFINKNPSKSVKTNDKYKSDWSNVTFKL